MAANLFRPTLAACAAALVLLVVPGTAAAVNPPACDPSVYPYAFLYIDGSTFAGNTRWLELRQNPKGTDQQSGQSDPEYPFQLRVDKSDGTSRTFTVHDYAQDQFPVTFASGVTAHASATYVEVHTEENSTPLPYFNVRCTRTISADFKKPPKPKRTKAHRGHGGGGGHREDDGEDRRV
jgi:hypothetical protein